MGSFAEATENLSKGEGIIGDKLSGFVNTVAFFTGVLTTPVLVLVRRNFGERYLSYTSIILVLFFLFPLPFILPSSSGGIVLCFFLFFLFLGASLYHIFVIRKRNREGMRWHSKYDGDILPFFKLIPVSESTLRLIFEPAFVFCVGLFFLLLLGGETSEGVRFGNLILPLWFIFTAPFMMILEKFNQSANRDRILDMIDAQIESQHQAEVLEGAPPEEAEGYVVRGISDASVELREQMLARLNVGIEKEDNETVTHGEHVVSNPSQSLPPRPPSGATE